MYLRRRREWVWVSRKRFHNCYGIVFSISVFLSYTYSRPKYWRKCRKNGRIHTYIHASVRNSLGPTVFFLLNNEINRHCYVAQFYGNAHWAEPSPMFAHRARPRPLNYKKRVPGACTRDGNCSSSSNRLYRQGVSQAQSANESGDERPRLRTS